MNELFNKKFDYPEPSDPDLQYKLYKKKEFYSYKIPERIELDNYDKIKKLRENQCTKFEIHPYQAYVSNFINPQTPYKGVLLFHGLGSGKCIIGNSDVYVNGQLVKIKDIWDSYSSNIVRDNENGEWSLASDDLYVNSLTTNNKIIKNKVSKLYREKINTVINEIILENGYNIGITQIHKLKKINGWSNDLNVGDYVAIPKILYNFPELNNIRVIDSLAHFLGWQIGKGVGGENIITIYENSNNIVRRLEMDINSIRNYYNLKIEIIKNSKLIIESKDYIKFIDNDPSLIPSFIMNSNPETIRIFLGSLFDACGIITDKCIKFILNNQNIKLVCILFKLLGIDVIIDGDIGIISGSNIVLFNKYIKLNIEHKVTDLNKLCMELESADLISTEVGDIQWVKIKTINTITYNDYVYDLEINNVHNYIASGIPVHNTCSGIQIAETFKSQVQKYGTKIHILVPGPLLKEMWKKALITCTGNTYRKYEDKSVYLSDDEKEKLDKNALSQALQYYKIMSYRNFTKKVLGDKIVDKRIVTGQKTKISYKKTNEGEYERDVAIDRIYSLSNTLIIVDEAHHLAGNSYGEALKMILTHKDSHNLKIVLLSATPMKNLADEIIDLVNFIRPLDSPIEREKIFTSQTNHLMELKPDGIKYFKKMVNGYISHVRGADPLIYAKRIDKGVIPDGLLFTKVIKCMMESFQKETYLIATKEEVEDTLDRKSEAVANFTFPILSEDKKTIIGGYGKDGLNILINQIKIYNDELNKKIGATFFDGRKDNYISLGDDGKKLVGSILKYPNLRFFSVKFNRVLKKINKLIWGIKGPQTAFIYSNLVKVGITLFQDILLQNGYLEYQDDFSNYQFDNDTKCYYCGITFDQHTTIPSNIPNHKFYPATFLVITGKLGEEEDTVQEEKKKIIDNVFNNINNYEGKHIKFLLGSKVMSEGISLKNVGQVHILDVHYNLGNIDQAIGRAIRYCSHYSLMNENNVYPEVAVYKYVISLPDKLTTEEELYQKAELKHILIKKIERAMKEVAIDCPHNIPGNMFKEEIEKYKDCGTNDNLCPSQCDYTRCQYKCENNKLNLEYYDSTRNIYKSIDKNKLDYSTYNYEMSSNEINFVKNKIKDMYILNYIYSIDQIIEYVKNEFSNYKHDLYDIFFVYKALDDMIPITENDFNNFKDIIIDKYNRQGYLIYRNKYYIFQPFEQNENAPLYYRKNFIPTINNNISLFNYLQNKNIKIDDTTITTDSNQAYNFDDVFDYYEYNRTEWTFVGIIDKNPKDSTDVFKIRPRRDKILVKKRGTGIPSLKGAICQTAKNKKYLEKVAKELGLIIDKNDSRDSICNLIKNKLLLMEKYQTGSNKITYIIISSNNPTIPFPYNLEDRVDFIINNIKKELSIDFTFNVKTIKKTTGAEKGYPSFIVSLNLDSSYLNKINPKYNVFVENNHIKFIVE